MLAALFFAPAASHAQAINCQQCPEFTLAVSPNLACAVTVCYVVTPFTLPVCKTLNQGDEITLKCSYDKVWVNTCSGPYYLIPSLSGAICSRELKFAVGCCGNICNVPSPTMCTRLEVQPAPCASLSCP
jgi:hypothetical protein